MRILIADSREILRAGLRSLLEAEPDFEVVAEAGAGRTAVELVRREQPDIVLLEPTLPSLDGAEVTRRIVASFAAVKVLAVTSRSDAGRVSAMMSAGASGFVLKDSALEELVTAIRIVGRGGVYLCTSLGQELGGEEQGRTLATPRPPSPLTAREREVLQLLAGGNSTREVAQLLEVSIKTIGTHRDHIMDKLRTRSIADLTKYAIREGLTDLSW